ncbi:MAG: hypothetical protein C4617_05095 [Candidatus Liberibacter europaeus]|uniref:DUF669 domain-containing protein n=1 Tax=Candidatus Liberibacter europaeus TaxID=744859 RepID=A0A2T4VWI2_9HYPH|nr:hypothetical protein [Candidatus Liberibacter europaeus]PTL86144.1 MAG: hypothetical protein C4617_05095 [Candidatus Liberibacter europaeus]
MSVINYVDVEYVDHANPIPDKTIVKVCLTLKQGYCDRLNDGTPLGFPATESTQSGSIYLECEYTVIEGEYHNRKIFDIIGLYSPKGETWATMGRSFIKGILSSARRVSTKDKSHIAQKAFMINSYADLNGLVFLVEVKVERRDGYDPRNRIARVITPDHKDYERLMRDTHNPYRTSNQSPTQAHAEDNDVLDDEIPF